MTAAFFYFTGTGNSLVVAEDIAAHLDDVQMTRICTPTLTDVVRTDADVVGIVAPVYHTGLPTMVAEFVEKLDVDPAAYIFGVATYGDAPGVFFNELRTLFRHKSRVVSGEFAVQMPHNIHAQQPERQAALVGAEKAEAAAIAQAIRTRSTASLGARWMLAILEELTHKAVPGSGSLDKGFHVSDACIACDICMNVCPAQNIVMVDGRPQWLLENRCQLCVACLQWCPRHAISYRKENIADYHHPDVKVPRVRISPPHGTQHPGE